MKKFFSFLIVFLALVPAAFLVGCGKKDTAANVKGRTYVVTMAKTNAADVKDILDNNFRITFYDGHFTAEYGVEGADSYGSYLGSYTTDKNEVKLEITTYTGAFKTEIRPAMKFSTLKYEGGKLIFEDIVEGSVWRFTFEIPKTEK